MSVEEFSRAQQRLLKRYGVTAKSRFLEIEAVEGPVHALECGDGEPVVMVPGFGDPAAMWAPLLGSLPGLRCIAVDRPCIGLSGRAVHSTPTLRRLAIDFLGQTLDALGLDRAVFVANSMGSLWTMWFALDHPDRVIAMAHVGCPAFILGTSAPLLMRLMSVRPIGKIIMGLSPPSRRQVEGFAAMIGEDLSNNPELIDLLVAAQNLPGVQSGIRDLLHAAVRVRGARPAVALAREQLAAIQQPVLLVWGPRDRFGSIKVGRAAAESMPNATFHDLGEGGHIPWVQHPDAVATAVRPFLNAHVLR